MGIRDGGLPVQSRDRAAAAREHSDELLAWRSSWGRQGSGMQLVDLRPDWRRSCPLLLSRVASTGTRTELSLAALMFNV